MQKRLALCIITSKADEEKADSLAESLKSYVDEVVITGPKDFKWIDDFAAARNFNFSQAKADWILWLDADDTLENPEKLRDLISHAEQNQISGYWFKYKYLFDENGNCIDEHWKLQLVKNDGHFTWKGAVHEDILQLRPVTWLTTTDVTRIHHTDKDRSGESFTRNLRILLKESERDPNEPRTKFYLGRTYIASAEFEKAIEVLNEYLKLSGWDDERYEARLLIGQAHISLGNIDAALQTYHDAILEREKNPEAYIYKATCYLNKEEWDKALNNYKIALELPLPEAVTFFNPMFFKRDVYQGIAVAYLNLGKLDDAFQAAQIAYKADPKNQDIKDLYYATYQTKYKYDTAQKFLDIIKYAEKFSKDQIPSLLNAVPRPLFDNPLVIASRRRFLKPKKWDKGTIAVFCGTSAEDWTPDSLSSGIGGSETAVIQLTERLSKLGWKVTVFNQGSHPPEGRVFDGVEYQNFYTFNPEDEFDVLWVWRLPEAFDWDLKARLKLLDLHDVMNPLDFPKERLERIDKIFVKTNYHRSLLPDIPDEKFVVVGNGIDLTRFDFNGSDYEFIKQKDENRFCYTSSPNRGLDVLLQMWPKIREKQPDFELHVYYGWETFYQLEKNNPERMAWMKKVQALMAQPGVIDHGRVGQNELAQDLMKTAGWLYPTNFPEIDCITAKEMQAAGVYSITSGYAALEESQKTGVKIPGDIYDLQWQEKFIDEVTKGFSSPVTGIREVAKQFDWDLVATKWNEVCK